MERQLAAVLIWVEQRQTIQLEQRPTQTFLQMLLTVSSLLTESMDLNRQALTLVHTLYAKVVLIKTASTCKLKLLLSEVLGM